VALKALTWLFKDNAQPLPTASVRKAQLAAPHGGLASKVCKSG